MIDLKYCQPRVDAGSGREPFSESLEKTPTRMGLPIGEPHVRQKAMIDHWCYAGQPDEDKAAAGGVRVHIHTDRRSGPSPGRGRLLPAPTV